MNQPPYPPAPEPAPQQSAMPGCWWHPDRQTGLRCARCERPACPACLREAAVGYQCVDCVQAARNQQRAQQKQYRAAGFGSRTVAGARPSATVLVTPVLIVLNVLAYLITAVQAKSPMDNQLATLHQDGVLWPAGIAFGGEWWRLLTSGFLHYGLLHIAVNMFSLWMIGRDLERLLGKVRYLALYLVAMFGGAVSVYVFDEVGRATAGASGAIYGLLGALLVAVLRLKLNPTAAIGVIAVNLVISVSIPGISLLGHLGGLVIGALVMAAMVYAPEKGRAGWQAGVVVLLTVALIGLVVLRDAQLADQACGVVRGQFVCVDAGSTG